MLQSTIEKYQSALTEIRERLYSANILSNELNVVFIESTALQIRKLLELVSYLSVLVNADKLNHKEKNEWRAQKIIETLAIKTTIFYPLPCRVIVPQGNDEQPVFIPLNSQHALSQEDFVKVYSDCGRILHAQHPFKDQVDFQQCFTRNKIVLERIKNLLQNHVIAIRHDAKKYTFLHVQFDFTNDEKTRPTVIREFKTAVFDELQLKRLFEEFWDNANVSDSEPFSI